LPLNHPHKINLHYHPKYHKHFYQWHPLQTSLTRILMLFTFLKFLLSSYNMSLK
jgi:hypothetical protein